MRFRYVEKKVDLIVQCTIVHNVVSMYIYVCMIIILKIKVEKYLMLMRYIMRVGSIVMILYLMDFT